MRRALAAVALLVALLATSCGGGTDERSGIAVFAASSLTEAFTQMGENFEAEYPQFDITFNFFASSALAQQVNEGAPADAFVSADPENMQKVVDAGNATDPMPIARNGLALLVEKRNPEKITGLKDLDRPGLVFVLCAPAVPCGKFGDAALQKAGVTAAPRAREENVKAVVARVTLGEADAGIVYATDVLAAAGKADGVDIAEAGDRSLQAQYEMAVVTTAKNRTGAKAWLAYVTSAKGQRVLQRFGFLGP